MGKASQMARNQYFVVLSQGEWKITHNQKHYGPYASQKAAIRAAVDAAHSSKGDSQVLVQGANNQFRTEWTYGHDPYPPPG
ncbi:DUF2188 domain-containing protein [Sphingomonas sp. NIBR02145]|uniref:DUF2188 domain-containing protein n=1 Tax=Sphingomonas sp. NIBR02145 TaxID=3014784 RepID=UPI00339077A7